MKCECLWIVYYRSGTMQGIARTLPPWLLQERCVVSGTSMPYLLLITVAPKHCFHGGKWIYMLYRETSRCLSLSQAFGSHVHITSSDWSSIIHNVFLSHCFSHRECLFRCLFLRGLSCQDQKGRGSRTSYGLTGHRRPWQASLPDRGSELWVPEGAANRVQGFREGHWCQWGGRSWLARGLLHGSMPHFYELCEI